MKRIISYENEKEIYNGTTTIVIGFSYFNGKVGSELDKKITDVIHQLRVIDGFYGNEQGFESKKIAKLCEGDTYDPKIGKKVAATKVELKTSADAIEYVEETIRDLEKLKEMLTEAVKPTKERLDKLELEQIEF
ncbi:MAG: hypothetical protein J6Z11_17140 [Candidatus Riflebacteria bacterium]|nr:hypothetical protein [Candidatus Riflebacteria bacterium]